MKEKSMDELPLMNENEGIVLFYPNVSDKGIDEVTKVLRSSSRRPAPGSSFV